MTHRNLEDARTWQVQVPIRRITADQQTEQRTVTIQIPAHTEAHALDGASSIIGKLAFGTGWWPESAAATATDASTVTSREPDYKAEAEHYKRVIAAILAAGLGYVAIDPEVYAQVDPAAVRAEFPPPGQPGKALFYLDGVGPEDILAGLFSNAPGGPPADGPDGPVDTEMLAKLGRDVFGLTDEQLDQGGDQRG